MPKMAAISLCTAIGIVLSSCSEYLDRRDTLMFGSGEAVQTNIVTQVVDPWPPHARNRSMNVDGERLQGAIRRYRSGTAGTGAQATPGATPAAAAGSVPSAGSGS
jgi:type IV pilus biogenesis protein CpaD/CtpE